MNDLLNTILKFWPLIAGAISFIFTLGIIWQRTQIALKGVKKLFLITTDMITFKAIIDERNKNLDEHAKILAANLIEHGKEDLARHTETLTRIDQLYRIILEKLNK